MVYPYKKRTIRDIEKQERNTSGDCNTLLSNKTPKKPYKRQKTSNNKRPCPNIISSNDEVIIQKGTSLFNISRNEVTTGNCKKFKCNKITFSVNFLESFENKTFGEATDELTNMFIELHSQIRSLLTGKDKINLVISHSSLRAPICFGFMDKADFMNINLEDSFFNVIQSFNTVQIGSREGLKVDVAIARIPSGKGNKKRKIHNSMNEMVQESNYIVEVFNNDKLCAIRAVLISIGYFELAKKNRGVHSDDKLSYYKKLSKQNSKVLKEKSFEFLKAFDIENNRRFGIEIFPKLEEYFNYEYQITVIGFGVDKSGEDKSVMSGLQNLYIGDRKSKDQKSIYILHIPNHYNSIISIFRLYNTSYFCDKCKIPYKLGSHTCDYNCIECQRGVCLGGFEQNVSCEFCFSLCKSEECLRQHLDKICRKARMCSFCNTVKRKYIPHVCLDEKYCYNCKSNVKLDHMCYIQTEKEKNELKKRQKPKCSGFIFYDYEAYADNEGRHIANLIKASRICNDCLSENMCSSKCQKNLYTFYNNTDFCDWLFCNENNNYTAIAHYFKGYDGIHVINYIYNHMTINDTVPEMIMTGSKINYMIFRGVRFIDSLNFLSFSLEKFSDTFGITELKKGFFPHTFNKPENFNYIGVYPAKEYYQSELFSIEKKTKFDKWYAQNSHKEFYFQKELEEYCESDVKLLQEGCLQFRKIILEITGVDALAECMTIAQLCHLIYRKHNMESKSIAIIPEKGFNAEQKNSKISLLWLKYIIHNNPGLIIQHKLNKGEKKIGPYFVDGYSELTKTIYEFNGCYFHGCPKCFSSSQYSVQFQKCFGTIYRQHSQRIEEIKRLMPDHKVVQMWECDFKNKMKSDNTLSYFIEVNKYVNPINPRDSLFGGRTNAIKIYKKCEQNEKIKYVDFKSLYPYVQKYCSFPIGHPEIITENFQSFENYYGIVCCTILPPQNLYIPVLPVRIDGKLIFPLCYCCAKEKLSNCFHNDNQRMLTGTWVTLEVEEAIKNGYVLVKIHEIWHYKEKTQYDTYLKSGGLFTKQVDLFLKYKEEASGFPEDLNSDNEKEAYIKEFEMTEGIKLDKTSIKKNPGLRSVMKLCLNSFWGRFGMQTNKVQVKFVNNYKEWLDLIAHDKYTIHSVDDSINGILVVFFSEKEIYFEKTNNTTNVIIAAFTTCHGRLRLFSEMKKLDKRVIYHDTDSIIYSVKEGEYEPRLGNNLGDLTNEISLSDGGYISEIICVGPKNYAYKTASGKTKCVIKGFSLNYLSSLTLNFEKIKDIILKKSTEDIFIDHLVITRKKQELRTKTLRKKYGVKYDKRIILQDGSWLTIPYGYKMTN